jgi:hypothetical protein
MQGVNATKTGFDRKGNNVTCLSSLRQTAKFDNESFKSGHELS